jgi:hypothetical protein
MRQRLHRFFTSPRLTYWNAGLCTAAIAANILFQAFCRPVLWAAITLIIAFVPVIIYARERDRLLQRRTLVFFLFGIAACICVYCMLFMGRMTLFLPLLMFMRPYAIFGLLPYFLLIQILYHTFTTSGSIKPFVSAVFLCILFAAGMATWFDRHFDRVQEVLKDPDKSALVPANYMTELMLGMHVKYHISFCAYDGWRPPLHDPSIVVAAWLNVPFHPDPHRQSYQGDSVCPAPLFYGGQRIEAYKRVFPNNAIWQSCSCALDYSGEYFKDADRGGDHHFEQVPRER